METLLLIIISILFVLFVIFFRINERYKRFQKTMKPGDNCYMYYSPDDTPEVRTSCKIIQITGNLVKVRFYNGTLVKTKKELYV